MWRSGGEAKAGDQYGRLSSLGAQGRCFSPGRPGSVHQSSGWGWVGEKQAPDSTGRTWGQVRATGTLASSEEILCKEGGRELALNDRLLPSASLSCSWVPPRVPYPGPCRMLSHNLRAAP